MTPSKIERVKAKYIVRFVLGLVVSVILINNLAEVLSNSRNKSFYPTADLVRAIGDTRVYYLEEGKKRWVESFESFQAQGFSWDAVRTIAPEELMSLPEGDKITSASPVILAGEETRLPDLVPLSAEEIQYDTLNGRKILRFTSVFLNQGGGFLEVAAKPLTLSTDALKEVFQRVVNTNGTERLRLTGYFLWHAMHGHYHVTNVMGYMLEPADSKGTVISAKEKVSFCLRDDRIENSSVSAATRTFSTCTSTRQGVSVGWADVYSYSLPDQYLDVHGLTPATYRLLLDSNPKGSILENRLDNNRSIVIAYMDPANNIFNVLGKAVPLPGFSSFPDGTTIRSQSDNVAYVMFHNKKRLFPPGISTTTRGIVLPNSIIETIFTNNLIKNSNGVIYALNDKGYRRLFPSPDAYNSYGFNFADIALISEHELVLYPEAKYIRQTGSDIIYEISGNTKKIVNNISAISPDMVHVINIIDFNSYTTVDN
ncbi:MAG: hypothetical protein A3A97_02190 [Candidatus Terrybacteria bacterium RIFCSPLOWO2_01_FULL_40_23]|uniref:Uncharacterized protein n=1 Tax=Candidatus Terrybacteria bacterium RIFCSPLOWO2_01_FULL_40_23 TaxID=1802366 RepID=A0A1G2PVV5_9BACT|nr:MAG: hypothetical protein A3A97_02190 [Candidatus Terrybacteria bacterium RIFCSPLOWO2_01_FULL_40_23]